MKRSFLKEKGVLFRLGRFAFTLQDLLALAVFAAAAAVFFISAPYGITEPDEAFYQTVVYRLTKGDALIADEWHMVQLNAFFWYLPYRAFTFLLGGTEGLLLALRCFYAALKLVFFAAVYFSLRSCGYSAVIAAAIYAGSDTFGIKTMNYYSVCANACLLAALILFVKKEPKPRHIVLAGFLFSMGVLAEPPAAFVWCAYSAAVLIVWLYAKKKKKPLPADHGYILRPETWRLLFYGVLIGFALFLTALTAQVFFFAKQDLSAVWTGVRQMLFSSEYSVNGQFFAARLEKLLLFARCYGTAQFFLFFVLLAVSFFRVRRRPDRARLWFTVLAVWAAVLCVGLFCFPVQTLRTAEGECVSHPLIPALMGAPAFAFTKNKNKKIFAFWLFSVLVSLCVDLVSDCTFGSVLYLACVPAVILVRDFLREQKAPAGRENKKPAKRAEKAVSAVLACAVLFFPVYEAAHYAYMSAFHETEYVLFKSNKALTAEIPSGVYRGIRTLPELAQSYALAAEDAAAVRGLCKNGLFVAGLAPSFYMDADVNVRTYSTFAWILDGWRQTELWWDTHPEKRPDVVYIPQTDVSGLVAMDFTVEEKLDRLRELADITVAEGRFGIIVQINAWR